MFSNAAEAVLAAKKDSKSEGFSNGGYPVDAYGRSTARMIGGLVYAVLMLFLVLLIGQYLWNNHAVKLVSFLKPSRSVVDILGLVLLLRLLGL